MKYRLLLQFAGRQRQAFALILALTLAGSALVAVQPWPMKVLVDHVLGPKPLPEWMAALGAPSSKGTLLIVVVIAGLVLFALNAVVDAVLAWTWTRAGRRMVYDVAEELFARLQRRSLLYHQRAPVGDTMGRITVDSWSAYQVLDTVVVAPGHALLAMAAMILLMAQLDPMLTWISVAIAPLMVGASFLVGKPLRAAAKLKREIETRIQSHLQQTLSGIPVVQAFTQEEREHERLQQYAAVAIGTQQRAALVGSINSLSSGLVTTLGTGVVLWFGARHVLEGTLSIGAILVFLVYLNSLQTQMKTLANTYTSLQSINASVERAVEALATPPEISDKPGAGVLGRTRGEVRVQGVTFGYEAGQPVLRDVSMDIRSGETIAIVGPTGAGKTTLVNLIPRFFDPWDGRVLIDGEDVRDLQLQSVRRNVALVLQEPVLFPMTIAENIAFGRPDATRAEIEAAARAANAHEFIERLPEGYETVIGERGGTLSGGERQRISIARALLKDALILILDEPTSAVDAETESSILEALERLKADRTTLIIAHRLSTVKRADRVVVLRDGRIEETGTHAELMLRGQLYARFHNIQFERHGRAAARTR
ncbi:MAG: ABC transporter ATP-binding protein/permease [Verrucomicrobia subdivision 3 bacterium]|nr:ABC transporter ATP-binding protein/permease [Limisphaerales bacterium]